MQPSKKSSSSENKNISINGDVSGVVISGDNNTVNQTIIQKFFNIFKSDSETLEHRNRRILLGHVENAWIKGVLDASLHGAALLDLGIKQDTTAVTPPLTINNVTTEEAIPAGTSMLEIFDSIGMGRSLLILGAPGSGKTTMLLELTRQLIARARGDVTESIPMVFNLASWTEKLSLADWLAQELNNLYSVPRKTAPDWVKGDKLLLLLDGLDEVRQESRAKCVEAINTFRKEHGLTSLAVCSRSQDYTDLNAKLSFEGAIEVQPLTQKQITEFFNRFGKEMAGIKQVLKKDSVLREMAETPLFLSIMIMTYWDKQDVEISVLGDEKARRKHLFYAYINHMFERRLEYSAYNKNNVLHWLSWLASQMVEHNQAPYLLEDMQPKWLSQTKRSGYELFLTLMLQTTFVLVFGMSGVLFRGGFEGLFGGIIVGLFFGLFFQLISKSTIDSNKISTVDTMVWNWKQAKNEILQGRKETLIENLKYVLVAGLSGSWFGWSRVSSGKGLILGLGIGLILGLGFIFITMGVSTKSISQTTFPGQRILFSTRNSLITFIIMGLTGGLIGRLSDGLAWLSSLLFLGLTGGLYFGGFAIIQHYSLRLFLARNNFLPWRLVPFLDHCVDLIFLRRVGGGYIFVHRLLMEHFAEMHVETPTSKGN